VKALLNWSVKKACQADTKTWVVIALVILLFLGGGIAGTMLVLRKRKYGRLVHERNQLLEEKEAAKAQADVAFNEKRRAELEKKRAALEKKADAIDDKIIGLERKHDQVKLGLEDVSSWDDLRIN